MLFSQISKIYLKKIFLIQCRRTLKLRQAWGVGRAPSVGKGGGEGEGWTVTRALQVHPGHGDGRQEGSGPFAAHPRSQLPGVETKGEDALLAGEDGAPQNENLLAPSR